MILIFTKTAKSDGIEKKWGWNIALVNLFRVLRIMQETKNPNPQEF